jgi:hypothetical protein
MTGNAINAKSEALELHELSSEELDAVSGGDKANDQRILDDRKQMGWIKVTAQLRNSII